MSYTKILYWRQNDDARPCWIKIFLLQFFTIVSNSSRINIKSSVYVNFRNNLQFKEKATITFTCKTIYVCIITLLSILSISI